MNHHAVAERLESNAKSHRQRAHRLDLAAANIRRTHLPVYPCARCSLRFTSETALTRHMVDEGHRTIGAT